MSEELKTPLNIISGFTEILSEAKLDSRQKELFKIIKSSIEIMSSLVNDILDYSKIESGSLLIEKHPFNIKKFLKRMLKFPKIKAKEKNIITDFNIDENIPSYVNGDKIRLHQILMNILGNAIKFTDQGYIKLNVDLVNQSKEEAEIKFTIQDNGSGMSQHKIDLIYERYNQEDNPRLFGGSGLGLCIANKLVELQKGKLYVESQLGQGSEFIFSIKFQLSNEQEIEEILTAETKEKSYIMQNFQGKRILLAAENAINANLIKKVFEGTGAQIDVSENGKSCIEKLKQNSYDIILMDLFIPEMDGFETTKLIRKTLKLEIPILGFSANVSELDKEKCLKEGMNDYITKPFKIKELFKKIFKLLPLTKFELPAECIADLESSKKLPIENVEGLPSQEKIETISATSPKIPKPPMSFHDFLDHEIFKEYTKNDKVFEESLIQMFLKEIPKYFMELEIEIKKRNFIEIKKAVYKLKSPLAIFGYKKIVQKLINIEKLCDLGETEILKDTIESKHYLDSILKEMKTLHDSYAGS